MGLKMKYSPIGVHGVALGTQPGYSSLHIFVSPPHNTALLSSYMEERLSMSQMATAANHPNPHEIFSQDLKSL